MDVTGTFLVLSRRFKGYSDDEVQLAVERAQEIAKNERKDKIIVRVLGEYPSSDSIGKYLILDKHYHEKGTKRLVRKRFFGIKDIFRVWNSAKSNDYKNRVGIPVYVSTVLMEFSGNGKNNGWMCRRCGLRIYSKKHSACPRCTEPK